MIFFLGLSPKPKAQGLYPHTIYGDDSRVEISAKKEQKLQLLTQRIVALVDQKSLEEASPGVQGHAASVGKEYQLCRDERFYHQPSLSFCTGFFIHPRWVVTAKHCVEDLSCRKFALLLNYRIEKAPDLYFAQRESLKCTEIIESSSEDLAFLRVENHSESFTEGVPSLVGMPMRETGFEMSARENSLLEGEALQLIGFPLGLPMKWANGQILAKKKGHIYADLDAFEGNSGSPVFDWFYQWAGLLLGGDEDFEASEKNCRRSYRCRQSDGCEGEEILSVMKIQAEFARLVQEEDR